MMLTIYSQTIKQLINWQKSASNEAVTNNILSDANFYQLKFIKKIISDNGFYFLLNSMEISHFYQIMNGETLELILW